MRRFIGHVFIVVPVVLLVGAGIIGLSVGVYHGDPVAIALTVVGAIALSVAFGAYLVETS